MGAARASSDAYPTAKIVGVDISPAYEPSPAMRSGEPYIDGYKVYIDQDLRGAGFGSVKRSVEIDGRAETWNCLQPNQRVTQQTLMQQGKLISVFGAISLAFA